MSNKTWYTSKWAIVSYHVIAWIAWFVFPYLVQMNQQHLPPPHVVINGRIHHPPPPRVMMLLAFAQNLILLAIFYLNAFRFVPRLLYRRKLKKYLLLMLSLIVVFTYFIFKLHEFATGEENVFRIPRISFPLFFLFIVTVSTSYRIIWDKIIGDRLQQEKENANLKTELQFLRSQISPHFVFNVLNNMVSLARKKSDLLEPSLIRLSGLMRYILYEANADKVLLSKEIEYLQSYVELQQQRFAGQVDVQFAVHCENDIQFIEPMLLIPFVENAFKHGVGMIENPSISIQLDERGGTLYFQVRNNFNNSSGEIKDKTSGIGLSNAKRRLDLLYGNRHSLFITKDVSEFRVQLQLNLT